MNNKYKWMISINERLVKMNDKYKWMVSINACDYELMVMWTWIKCRKSRMKKNIDEGREREWRNILKDKKKKGGW